MYVQPVLQHFFNCSYKEEEYSAVPMSLSQTPAAPQQFCFPRFQMPSLRDLKHFSYTLLLIEILKPCTRVEIEAMSKKQNY